MQQSPAEREWDIAQRDQRPLSLLDVDFLNGITPVSVFWICLNPSQYYGNNIKVNLLKNPALNVVKSIDNIALQLKFTESQSFIRWFKQQAGQTSGQYWRNPIPSKLSF